jgi:hypothetical protein
MQERLTWLESNGYIQDNVINHTRTTRFLMPLIGVSEFSLKHINPKLLINAHCTGTDDNLIYIILNKLEFLEESETYLITQNLNEHFIDHIDDEQEHILIYQIPQHFEDDYNKILLGKYSHTSTFYKEVLCRIYGISSNTTSHLPTIYDCLYPTALKRKLYAEELDVEINLIDEVSSKPNLDYEIFKTIKELKENYEPEGSNR